MRGPRVELRVELGRAAEEGPAPAPPREAVPRIVRLLALAHRWHGQLKRGEVDSQAEIAERVGLTRARVTQIMDLRWLAPGVQERLVVDGKLASFGAECRLCTIGSDAAWDRQLRDHYALRL